MKASKPPRISKYWETGVPVRLLRKYSRVAECDDPVYDVRYVAQQGIGFVNIFVDGHISYENDDFHWDFDSWVNSSINYRWHEIVADPDLLLDEGI